MVPSDQTIEAEPSSGIITRLRSAANSVRVIDCLVFALIVAVAAATRLTYLNFVEFKDDEAKVMALAVEFLDGKRLPLVGIVSSVGINNPPAYIYLMAIPLAISRDPAVATGFVGLLGVGAVVLCYRLCLDLFGRRTAQIASLLYAAAPWGVLFSRKAQAQDVVPFFTLLLVAGLVRFARGDGNRHLVAAVLWLSVLVQLHFGAVALAPLVVVVALANWRRLRLPAILTAGVLTALLWLPYLLFQVVNDWVDLRMTLGIGGGAPELSFSHLHWIVDMAASNAYWGFGEPSFALFYRAEEVVFYVGLVLLVALVGRNLRRDRADQRYLILALWLAIPPLFWVRHSTPLYPHYFQTVVPVQFILMGLVCARLEGWTRGSWQAATTPIVGKAVQATTFAFVLALVATQTYQFFSWQRLIVDGTTPPGYGAPLSDRKAFIEKAVESNAGSPRTVLLAASDDDYRRITLEYLAAGRLNLKTFDDRDTFIAPPDDGGETLFLVSNPTWFAGRFLRQYFPERLIATVPNPADDSQFEIYRLNAADRSAMLARPEPRPLDRVLPIGIRFLGYVAPARVAAGSKASATLFWRVETPPPPKSDYGLFFHLVGDDGTKVAQVDGLNYGPIDWRPGDVIATEAMLDISPKAPAGRYWLELGAYQRPDLNRLPQKAPDGSTADRARLGPIRLDPSGTASTPEPDRIQTARLGSDIELGGFDLDSTSLKPGGVLDLTLSWRALATPNFDYATFVHLVDADGKLIGQSDGQPGPYPTTLWRAGETVRDARQIALPPTLTGGTYRLRVGLYRNDTGARLPVDAGGDFVTLDLPLEVR